MFLEAQRNLHLVLASFSAQDSHSREFNFRSVGVPAQGAGILAQVSETTVWSPLLVESEMKTLLKKD